MCSLLGFTVVFEIRRIAGLANANRCTIPFYSVTCTDYFVNAGASPRGGLRWECPPHLPEGVPEIDADSPSLDGCCVANVAEFPSVSSFHSNIHSHFVLSLTPRPIATKR